MVAAVSRQVRGLAGWRPRSHALALLEPVLAIPRPHRINLPLKLRQVFCAMGGVHGDDKSELSYHSIVAAGIFPTAADAA